MREFPITINFQLHNLLYTSLFGVRRPIQGDHPAYAEYVPTLGSIAFHAKASSHQNVAICIV